MDYCYKDGTMIVKNVTSLDLGETLDCGQSFRWRDNGDGSFTGVAYEKLVTVSMQNGDLHIENTTEQDFEKIWRNYFDLDLDYDSIRSSIGEIHPVLK